MKLQIYTALSGHHHQASRAAPGLRSYAIQAIVHATPSDYSWLQVKAAAVQAAKDLKINSIFDLYDSFDQQQMADDIVRVATWANDETGGVQPDTLVVSLPSEAVRDAIRLALQHLPVFGINSGHEAAQDLGLLGFVSMDEFQGGQLAAEEFVRQHSQRNQNNNGNSTTGKEWV